MKNIKGNLNIRLIILFLVILILISICATLLMVSNAQVLYLGTEYLLNETETKAKEVNKFISLINEKQLYVGTEIKNSDDIINIDAIANMKDNYIQLEMKNADRKYKIAFADKKLYIDLSTDEEGFIYDNYSDEYNLSFNKINRYNNLDQFLLIAKPIIEKRIELLKETTIIKEKLYINGVNQQVVKHTYETNKQFIYAIEMEILEAIKSNEDTLDNYRLINNLITKDNTIKNIDNKIAKLKEETLKLDENINGNKIYFNVYTKGLFAKIVQFEIIDEEKNTKINVLIDNSGLIINGSFDMIKSFTIKISDNNIDILYEKNDINKKIIIKKENDNKYNLEIDINDLNNSAKNKYNITSNIVIDSNQPLFDLSSAKLLNDTPNKEELSKTIDIIKLITSFYGIVVKK